MMLPKNQTLATELILLGFPGDLKTNIALFILFFLIYSITCTANGLVMSIILANPPLHKPMYLFLINLSFVDLCYSSNAAPKLLIDLCSTWKTISLSACFFQMYSSLYLGGVECILLAIMAYDRYVAICHPLHYNVLMSMKTCKMISAIVWIGSFVVIVLPSLIVFFPLCNPNKVNHFMCEILAVIKLACEDVSENELMIFTFSFIVILFPFIFILVSYIRIISCILKINSEARAKAFSTCTSHLTVVGLFYTTGMTDYSMSSFNFLANLQKYASVIYVIITPMVNPLIYSLKNQEVKDGFRKLVVKITVFPSA